ncbi:MAG: L-2-hydroxyglutarate oxidase [Gammaproteobacteria bacterium]|nr:MAG: L-2-hydroxyglutarate oxidase [Gammaproteobacteria bacterium]
MSSSDFVIIGAGIIGLTTAFELKKHFPKASVAVLEKEPALGRHASGRNSGVLHSGIYYGADTLKAKVCSKGAFRMMEFADEHGIPYRRSGKVIIATREQDIPTVERLLQNARDSGIRAEKLDEKGVKEIEPYANPYRVGIYSPDTAVIDSWSVLEKLRELLTQSGVHFALNRTVTDVAEKDKCLFTSSGKYSYGYVFNCAGASADLIARKFGLCRDYTLLPFKGLYYKLRKERVNLVRSNIYPVPDISLPFLGVHLTRVINGDVYAGPTAIPAFGRENYGVLQGIRLGEGMRVGWHLARLYLRNQRSFRRMVHSEIGKYSKTHFIEATRRLVPDIMADDFLPSGKVGIRPQLVNLRTQKLEMDFVVESTPSSLHVLNAISPAFTSAFAFSELLVERYRTAHD